MLGKEHAKVCPKNVVGPDDMLRGLAMVDSEGGLLAYV